MSSHLRKFLSGILTLAILLASFTMQFGTVSAADKAFPNGKFSSAEDYLYQYLKPASLSAPGESFAPSLNGSTVSGAPIISTVTQTAAPGESLVLEGEGFAGGTVYIGGINATSGKFQIVASHVIRGDNNTVMVVVDKTFREGVYLVWAENSKGISYPVRVNNPVDVWSNTPVVTAGSEISIFGKNLKVGDRTPYVYLNNTLLQITYSNPNKIIAKIPESTAKGTYTVNVHNGTGGNYGWTVPLSVTVGDDIWENSPVVNVSSVEALKNAVSSAKAGSTIKIANGTYRMQETIFIHRSLRFIGSGKTVFIYDMDGSGEVPIFFAQTDANADIVFDTVSFEDCNNGLPFGRYIRTTRGNSFVANNCTFNTAYHSYCGYGDGCTDNTHNHYYTYARDSMYIQNIPNVTITNCTFLEEPTGFGITYGRNVIIKNNKGYGGWTIHTTEKHNQGAHFAHLFNCQNVELSNNYATAKLVQNEGQLTNGDKTYNRFAVAHNGGHNFYFGENTVENIGHVNDNSGEQFLLEDLGKAFDDYATAVNGNKLTFEGVSFENVDFDLRLESRQLLGRSVAIVSGKGIGQYRYVTGFEGDTLTLNRPWDIEPDENSRIMILRGFRNVIIRGNDITGPSNYLYASNATGGLQAYASTMGLLVTENKFKNLMTGVLITSMYFEEGVNTENPNEPFSIFNNLLISNNIMDETHTGINLLFTYADNSTTGNKNAPNIIEGGKKCTVMKNTVVRGNTISNTKFSDSYEIAGLGADAIHIGTDYRTYTVWGYNPICYGAWIADTLIEDNIINRAENAGVRLAYHQGGTVLKDNVMSGVAGGEVAINDMSKLVYVSPAKSATEFLSSSVTTPQTTVPTEELNDEVGDSSNSSQYVSENLIQNSGFDSAEYWEICNDAGKPVADPIVIKDGAAVFSPTNTAWVNLRQTVDVVPGATYVVKYKALINNSSNIQFAYRSGDNGSDHYIRPDMATGGILTTEIVPTGNTLTVMFKNAAGTVRADGIIDDVWIYMLKDPEGTYIKPAEGYPEDSLVEEEDTTPEEEQDTHDGYSVNLNSDFIGADNWALPNGMTIADGYLHISDSITSWVNANQRLNLKPNTTYGVFYKFKTEGNSGRLQVVVENGSERIYEGNINGNADSSWKSGMHGTIKNVSDTIVIMRVYADGGNVPAGIVDYVKLVELNANGQPVDADGNVITTLDGDIDSLMGDLNTDDKVDLLDIVRMKKVLANVEVKYDAFAANIVSSNDVLDAEDLVMLKKYVLGHATTKYVGHQ